MVGLSLHDHAANTVDPEPDADQGAGELDDVAGEQLGRKSPARRPAQTSQLRGAP